jgi:hypothetical protein
MRSIILSLACALAPTTARAECAEVRVAPAVLTTNPVMPKTGGGILVYTDTRAQTDEGEAAQPTWEFRSSHPHHVPVVPATITTLAPGLVVYTPASELTVDELHDGTTRRSKYEVGYDDAKPLATPSVKSIAFASEATRRGNAGWTLVQLAAPPPAEAVAMIVYNAKGTAMSYGLVKGSDEIYVYSHGPCSVEPTGTLVPRTGQKVTLRFVDQYGLLSKPSKPKKIARGK